MTPLLQKFAKDPNENVIETFPLPLEPRSKSLWIKLLPSGLISYLSRKVRNSFIYPLILLSSSEMKLDNSFLLQKSHNEMLDTTLMLDECKRLVENGQIIPVVAKSFLPNQYDQAFRHVSNLTRSALVQAHVGKSVIVFKVS